MRSNEKVWHLMHCFSPNEDGVEGIHLTGIGHWTNVRDTLKWLRAMAVKYGLNMAYRSRRCRTHGVLCLEERDLDLDPMEGY